MNKKAVYRTLVLYKIQIFSVSLNGSIRMIKNEIALNRDPNEKRLMDEHRIGVDSSVFGHLLHHYAQIQRP